MEYRFYLINDEGHSSAAESLCARDDTDAGELIAFVYDSCADVFQGYELWRGAKQLAVLPANTVAGESVGLANIASMRQESILDLEDRLQTSFACVKRSRKLLAATANLRLASSGPAAAE